MVSKEKVNFLDKDYIRGNAKMINSAYRQTKPERL